ncbi:toxin CptA [Luteibacter rhizovicinus]|uniref:Toxin CptA n=1 Tax=Luteibacter rhizovicinus TaxID=242606 RepID=A0A4R3Z1B7_9GAMM|nr:hypothetical protein [Luteibacter rhizovicinus]TCV97563.1 toxin CptA [Luteibacter rhizovicinus]
MTSARGIAFEYRPSGFVTRLLACVLVVAAFSVAVAALSPWIKTVLVVGIAVSGYARMRQFRAPCIEGVAWSSEGDWTVRIGADELPATLGKGRALGQLLAFELRWDTGRGHVLLYKDNADDDLRRTLRIRLATTGVR